MVGIEDGWVMREKIRQTLYIFHPVILLKYALKNADKWMVPLLVLAGVKFRFVQLPFSCIWLDDAFLIKLAPESTRQPDGSLFSIICTKGLLRV